jgi:hypothetical protein
MRHVFPAPVLPPIKPTRCPRVIYIARNAGMRQPQPTTIILIPLHHVQVQLSKRQAPCVSYSTGSGTRGLEGHRAVHLCMQAPMVGAKKNQSGPDSFVPKKPISVWRRPEPLPYFFGGRHELGAMNHRRRPPCQILITSEVHTSALSSVALSRVTSAP